MMGRGLSRGKAQSRFAHVIRRSVGVNSEGLRLKQSRVNFVPHHGQFSSGIGDGLELLLIWNRITFDRADHGSLSPFLPILFGVAALPTQRPISKGHEPSFSSLFFRSSSSAQISVPARPSR